MTGPFVILGIVVLLFAGYCALRFLDAVRESREQAEAIERWWAERAKYRAEQVYPDHVDTSSLLDDSSGALPETRRASCGEPIRFPSSATDRGNSAA